VKKKKKVSNNSKRTEHSAVRLTKAEKAEIEAIAKSEDRSVGAYMRHLHKKHMEERDSK